MDYSSSLKDIVTSAPAIYAYIAAGSAIISAAAGIFIHSRYFSKDSKEKAEFRKEMYKAKCDTRKEISLAKQETKRSKQETKRLELTVQKEAAALKEKEMTHEENMLQKQYDENEKERQRTRSSREQNHRHSLGILTAYFNHQQKIAGLITGENFKEVLVEMVKAHAFAAANASDAKIEARRRVRRGTYEELDQSEMKDQRTQYVTHAERIISGQKIYHPAICAAVEEKVDALEPTVEGLTPPFVKQLIYAMAPNESVLKILEEAKLGVVTQVDPEEDGVTGIQIDYDKESPMKPSQEKTEPVIVSGVPETSTQEQVQTT